VLEGVNQEQGVGFDLEEAAAIVGRGCDEKGAGSGCASRNRHEEWQQRNAVSLIGGDYFSAMKVLLKGTASAVPSGECLGCGFSR
jgi:hypothetical protein